MFFNGMNGGVYGTPFGGPFGGPVFTASFGPGFRATRMRAPRQGGNVQDGVSRTAFLQFLPLLIILGLSLLNWLPSLLGLSTAAVPNPHFAFSQSEHYSQERYTSSLKIPYYVNSREFSNHPIWRSIPEDYRSKQQAANVSPKLRSFERDVETTYTQLLYRQCQREMDSKERRMEAKRGFFGIGADWEAVRVIQAERLDSCERLQGLGLLN